MRAPQPADATASLAGLSQLLVLSPHLDDAALSLGATIAQLGGAGCTVRVATIFSGRPSGRLSPTARAFHARCGLGDDAMTVRAGEDAGACRLLGVAPIYGELPEALYRRDAHGKPRHDAASLFAAAPANEPASLAAIAAFITRLLAAERPQAVLAPLGVGGHVDHALTRTALRRCGLGATACYWYEDLPYALYGHLRGWEGDYAAGLQPISVALSPAAWLTKIAAVRQYRSQLDVLWYDEAPWPEQLWDYAVHLGAGQPMERLWRC